MDKNRKSKTYGKNVFKWAKTLSLKKGDLPGIVEGLFISAAIAILFYRSFFGMLAVIVVVPLWLNRYRSRQEENRLQKQKNEFKEYLMLISAALQTGYSLERAMILSEKEMFELFGKDSVLLKPIHSMNQKLAMNVQVEKAFEEFATEVGLEDAESLSEILSFSKRSGGDYGKQIRSTAIKLEEKLRVEQEIETMTTQKKLELKVMCVMPLGILAYISLTSISFIRPLYGNVLGISIMSLCLVGYGLFIMLGEKIIDIDI